MIQRVLKNSAYLFSANGIAAALSMLQGILSARLLGVAGFGMLGTIMLFTSTINNLASFRMNELVIKYIGHYTENADARRAAATFKAAILTEATASLVAFGLVLLLAPVGAKYFAKDPAAANLFILYGLVVLSNLIAESSTGLLQFFDRFRRIALFNLVQSLVTLVLIVGIYGFFTNSFLLAILLAYLIGKTISATGITLSALYAAGQRWGTDWWRTPLSLLRSQRSEMAHFAISTNISATVSLVTKDSELLWVSLLRGPVEAGYYKLALSLANLSQMPVDPLPQATYPELSRQVARGRWEQVRQVLRQGSLLAGVYSLLVLVGLAVLGQPLIRLFYTSEFLPAYPALMILLVGLSVANTFYWRRIMMLALGRADYPAKLNLILAALKTVATLLLVPLYGYLASAALLSAFYITGSFVSNWKIRSLLRERESAAAAEGDGGIVLPAGSPPTPRIELQSEVLSRPD